jgi:carbonic anhydrase
MSATEHLLHANASYAGTFPGGRPKQPKLRLAIIECMDSRLDTFAALGLQIGDAHIIRNGGGLITDDVLRSLAISQRALGTQAVMIMHHTDCGMHDFDDTAFRAQLTEESGVAPTWDVPGFTDIEGKVRESVAAVRNCGWILHRDDVRGFVYDVTTGQITEVN